MTPTELLKEIRKMPLEARRQVHDELHNELSEPRLAGLGEKQHAFITSMMKKGLITKLPRRHTESIERRDFKPITVTGEPISETIIRERR